MPYTASTPIEQTGLSTIHFAMDSPSPEPHYFQYERVSYSPESLKKTASGCLGYAFYIYLSIETRRFSSYATLKEMVVWAAE